MLRRAKRYTNLAACCAESGEVVTRFSKVSAAASWLLSEKAAGRRIIAQDKHKNVGQQLYRSVNTGKSFGGLIWQCDVSSCQSKHSGFRKSLEQAERYNRNKNHGVMHLESKAIALLRDAIGDSFDIELCHKNAKADLMLKPKAVLEDAWLPLQLKGAHKGRSECFYFYKTNGYDDMVLIAVGLPKNVSDEPLWCVVHGEMVLVSGFDIFVNREGYWSQFIVRHDELGERLMAMYYDFSRNHGTAQDIFGKGVAGRSTSSLKAIIWLRTLLSRLDIDQELPDYCRYKSDLLVAKKRVKISTALLRNSFFPFVTHRLCGTIDTKKTYAPYEHYHFDFLCTMGYSTPESEAPSCFMLAPSRVLSLPDVGVLKNDLTVSEGKLKLHIHAAKSIDDKRKIHQSTKKIHDILKPYRINMEDDDIINNDEKMKQWILNIIATH